MKYPPIKAYLFDLDGVIIDSERKYDEIWKEIDRQFPTGIDNFSRKIKGLTLQSILNQYFPETDICQQVTKMLYELEGKIIYDYCPGAKEFLDYLKAKKIPTALVTSSNEVKMERLWQHLPELKNMFDVIITGDVVSKSKPDPEGYLMAAKKLGIRAEECAVAEDSIQGVKAGKASGAFVIGIPGTLTANELAPYSDLMTENLMNLTRF